LLAYLPLQHAPEHPFWQQVFPQSPPQHEPQHAAFNCLVWLDAIALNTRTSERNAIVRFI
jgi:hypothetical protein